MRKWSKRGGVALALLLVLLAAGAWWLLRSESGTHFALARVQAALANKLSIAQVRGTLTGPLLLTGVRYHDAAAGVDVNIQSIKVDYSLRRLIDRRLLVHEMQVTGVDVRLRTLPTAPATAPTASLQSLLTPPLPIVLEHARVVGIAIAQDDKPVFAADTLEVAATWTRSALKVSRLALHAPDGQLDLNGALDSYRDYRGAAQAQFDWRIGSQRAAGNLQFKSNGKTVTLTLALNKPTAARFTTNVIANAAALPWSAVLDVPQFNPAVLGEGGQLKSLALHLQGSGDRAHANLNGNVVANAHRIVVEPLQLALSGQTLTLQNLRLRSDDASGTLTAHGKLQLDAKPLRGQLDAHWTDIELPADLVGQTLFTHGTLQLDGSLDQFGAQSKLALGPAGKLADLTIKLAGTPQKIAVQQFELKQAAGGLQIGGDITLHPQLAWALDAKATQLDPGAFVKQWPGAIDFALSTTGQLGKDGPHGSLKLDQLHGTLRQRALKGSADLTFAPPLALKGDLQLQLGKSTIEMHDTDKTRTNVRIGLHIASLGDWLTQAQGTLHGDILLQGVWPKLAAKGSIEGRHLALQDIHADALALKFDVSNPHAPDGRLNLDAKSISVAGHRFDTLTLAAHGAAAAWTVAVDAAGPQLGLAATMHGTTTRAKNGATDWRGTLSQLSITPHRLPAWALQEPVVLTWANGNFSSGELCLTAQQAGVCVAATQTKGTTQASFTLRHLPLAMLAAIATPESALQLHGTLDGSGELSRSATGVLAGHARIDSDAGTLIYPDDANDPLLAYSSLRMEANLAAQQGTIDIRTTLNHDGYLRGHVVLGAASAAGVPLSGEISAQLENLGIIDLLSGQTTATRGKLAATLNLSGTTAAPGIAGNLALTDFATEIPTAGLKLHAGQVKLHSDDGRQFTVTGSIASGNGKIAIDGKVGATADAPLALHIGGTEFLAADIPGAKVYVSPDLVLNRKDGKYTLSGTVTIPKADVDLSKLPGGGVATSSPDVVVIDAASAPTATSVVLDADITLKLGAGKKLDLDLRQGREVHLIGFGLNGYLSGQLALRERPGQPTSGRGQIVVDGTYKAYGQDLKIQQGRLLFADTPIDNPGLDIRATRSGFADPGVTAGLQVRGTAQQPLLSVFSSPAMEQSNALSYLVAGKPLSQLKSGEGDAVSSAAQALGSAGGDLLAKSIGSKLGLDDVGVSDNSAVGGAALTVGRYLSPRLYLSYGVGLFTPGEVVTLRYRLTRLLNIEIRNGTLSSRAGLDYRIEK